MIDCDTFLSMFMALENFFKESPPYGVGFRLLVYIKECLICTIPAASSKWTKFFTRNESVKYALWHRGHEMI